MRDLFVQKGHTLSLAESFTGGALSYALVKHARASDYFLGSIIAYSNAAKEKLLSVPPATLQRLGAVSDATARAMAQGALHHFGSTIAFSATGIAGPSGGSDAKPTGTAFFALAKAKGEILSFEKHFTGSREEIIEAAVLFSLEKILSSL